MKKIIFLIGIVSMLLSCRKDDPESSTPIKPSSTVLYPVTITVQDPTGEHLPGATVILSSPGGYSVQGITDSTGAVMLKAPESEAKLTASIGSVFYAEQMVSVKKGNSSNSFLKLSHRNASGKVLVVMASAEYSRYVLYWLGFKYDSVDVNALRDQAKNDSSGLLNYLQQYRIVFSDCDGGREAAYPELARSYGRFVSQGGKMYGGHYNFLNLQQIFPGYYSKTKNENDHILQLTDNSLIALMGFSQATWPGRSLDTYPSPMDLPPGAIVYAKMANTGNFMIVENHKGTGKYLFTNYHNQDITWDKKLSKLVRYFYYNL